MTEIVRRTAIVTGAARGIGAAIATRLAADGMAVAVVDLVEEHCQEVVERISTVGGRAAPVGVDVSDESGVAAAVERITAELGAPTVLVNNAGIIRDNVLQRMSTDDWDAVMAVHLRGPFLMARALRPAWAAAGWGRVVNLSSTSALGNIGQANYAAAKSGIQGFTKTLALELGRLGVTVNAVAPGFIATDMTASTADRLNMTFEDLQRQVAQNVAVGRVGQPEDIAAAVSFFCRDEASFVSGQVLYVAGGPKG